MKREPDNDGQILALDVATEMGFCVGKPSEEPISGSWKNKGGALPNSQLLLEGWLLGQWETRGRPALVVIEAPPSPRWAGARTNTATLLKLNGLCAEVERVCARAGVPCRQVHAQKWKSMLCGPLGRAKFGKDVKPYPPFEALALRGWQITNHNEADARGLWLYAVSRRAPGIAVRFDPLVRKAGARRR